MSFTTPNAFKIEIIETLYGQQLTNVEVLTIEDLQLLEEMTTSGASQTQQIHTKIWKNIIDQTINKHRDPDKLEFSEAKSQELKEKLDMILAKYN